MTYGSERDFPWSIDTVQLPAINFYKIIEVVVRAEPELSRDMVILQFTIFIILHLRLNT